MTVPPPHRPITRRQSRANGADWAKVESFTRTAMRIGAGDDVASLTSPAKKRRFALTGHSLRLASIFILVLALSGAIGAISQRSVEVAAIAPTSTSTVATGESAPHPTTPVPSASATQAGSSAEESPAPQKVQPETIVVHVSGEVGEPGVVKVAAPARVNDAITAAGGPTAKADLARINLAQPIEDGVHIHVPSPDDDIESVQAGAVGTGRAPGGDKGTAGAGGKVNINTADQGTLETIPGVGPVTAQAIIAWRTKNGAFTSIDQLVDVTGIGPKTLAQLREHVRV